MELRPYQQELVNDLRQALSSGKRKICAVLGCGGGKSVIQGTIAAMATTKGNRVLFLVHRRELCSQIEATFRACGVDFNLCTVGMVQTVTRHMEGTEEPSVIIVDECHHILSDSYKRIIERFSKACVLGFTATPSRMAEGGLGAVFQELLLSVSTKWLIDNKYLAPYQYYGVTLADTSKLHTRNGEFVKAEVEELMNKSVIYGDAVENWKKYAEGKKTIVYCSSVETSKNTVQAFAEAGVKAAHLDAKTPQGERERIVRLFRAGKITLLSNVDLFGEGFDVPDCEAVVLLRPTKSLTLHIQQSMRSMRYKEGKTAIILDHVGNYIRHGLPDDEREWSLKAKKRGERSKTSVKQCKSCLTVMRSTATKCPYCGCPVEQEQSPTKGPAHRQIDGITLQRILSAPSYAYKECRTWDELETFRSAKKYHFFWSLHKAAELGIPVPDKYKFLTVGGKKWRG